jgi:hypothetical protein
MRAYCILALGLFACGDEPTTEPDAGFAWELEDLGDAQGFSLRVPQFEVPAGLESQNCYFVRVPDINNGGPVYIDRVLTAMNPGSHHMNVFRVRTVLGLRPENGEPTALGAYPATVLYGGDYNDSNGMHPCWDSSNWADWPLVANSQHATEDNPYTDWQLPDTVAIKLDPGEMLMVQTHYVNRGDQPTLYGGKVGINFYKYVEPTAPQELGTLFATQQEIRICQSTPTVRYSGTCPINDPVTVIAANGHFHKRGRQFDVSTWDGASILHPPASAMFYSSDSWSHPEMALDLSVPVPQGGGVWWDCAYEWTPPSYLTCDEVNAKDPLQQGDCCYTFGGNTDTGEHCNLFLYYYPKTATDQFCN